VLALLLLWWRDHAMVLRWWPRSATTAPTPAAGRP
jgi:hypothetical protein